MSSLSPDLVSAVEHWIANSPEPQHQQFLTDALASQNNELASLFEGRVSFGTAGLRAPMGVGPNRMNRCVVRQTTAGLMQWLEENPFVVVGFDGRDNSKRFAQDVAAVVAAAGGRAGLFAEPVPTPVLANAVLDLGASAGVMITASHNPAADNGYKLYLRDGIQLVSPADVEIAAAIDEVAGSQAQIPLVEMSHPAIETLGDSEVDAHLRSALLALSAVPAVNSDVVSVYTAMHGVGGQHFLNAVKAAGFAAPIVVAEQFEPDANFSTVAFPNPEEDGALDLAFQTAANHGPVDVIVAHDPDADRLSLALERDGGFVQLRGDQVGVLFADYVLANTSGPRQVASSVVSSRLLAAIAESHGAKCTTTLTGFKWVARPMVEHPELQYVLGYEEALGYALSSKVRDKDGISAGLVALEIVANAKAAGETLWDRLDIIARTHGLFVQGQKVVRLDESSATASELVQQVLQSPPSVDGAEVVSVSDMTEGYLGLPPTSGVVVSYDDETRAIIRPSGTEPKVKIYLEVIDRSVVGEDEIDSSVANQRLAQYVQAWSL